MQETDLRAFVANCLKQDCTRFFSPGKFLQKQSATWKVFVFSALAIFILAMFFRRIVYFHILRGTSLGELKSSYLGPVYIEILPLSSLRILWDARVDF